MTDRKFPIASDGDNSTDHDQQIFDDNNASAVERPRLAPDSKPRRSQKTCMFSERYR